MKKTRWKIMEEEDGDSDERRVDGDKEGLT
jgi:hypothetical protein